MLVVQAFSSSPAPRGAATADSCRVSRCLSRRPRQELAASLGVTEVRADAEVHLAQAIQIEEGEPSQVLIRSAQWDDLGSISSLIVTEFSQTGGESATDLTVAGLPPVGQLWHGAQCLSQLNRLQQNFDRLPEVQHKMICATDREGRILGFVDIDCRPSTVEAAPPRPYLSDLAVSHKHRRMGIGRRLVEKCEEMCIKWNQNKIHLKVQDTNDTGMSFYKALNYKPIAPRDSVGHILLCKILRGPE